MDDYVEVTGVGRVDRTPDVLVARLGAEAACGTVGEALAAADAGFRAMVEAAVGAGVARRDVASAGLGVFMSYIEEFKDKNLKMVLFGMNDKVANTFEILGLNELLTIAKDKSEAKNLAQ